MPRRGSQRRGSLKRGAGGCAMQQQEEASEYDYFDRVRNADEYLYKDILRENKQQILALQEYVVDAIPSAEMKDALLMKLYDLEDDMMNDLKKKTSVKAGLKILHEVSSLLLELKQDLVKKFYDHSAYLTLKNTW